MSTASITINDTDTAGWSAIIFAANKRIVFILFFFIQLFVVSLFVGSGAVVVAVVVVTAAIAVAVVHWCGCCC